MPARSVGIVGIALLAIMAGGPAWAFSDNSGTRHDASTDQRPADYRYAGDGFNFSMSRNPPPSDDAPGARDADDQPPQASRPAPNVFQRIWRDLFGD